MSMLLKIQALWDTTPCQMVVTDSRRSFKMLVTTYQTTRRHIAEDVNLHQRRCKKTSNHAKYSPAFIAECATIKQMVTRQWLRRPISLKATSVVYFQVHYDKSDNHDDLHQRKISNPQDKDRYDMWFGALLLLSFDRSIDQSINQSINTKYPHSYSQHNEEANTVRLGHLRFTQSSLNSIWPSTPIMTRGKGKKNKSKMIKIDHFTKSNRNFNFSFSALKKIANVTSFITYLDIPERN